MMLSPLRHDRQCNGGAIEASHGPRGSTHQNQQPPGTRSRVGNPAPTAHGTVQSKRRYTPVSVAASVPDGNACAR